MDVGNSFLTHLWRNVSPLVECTLLMLLAMFLWTLADIVERGLRYNAATRQSRRFSKLTVGLLESRKWDDILAIAETQRRSHVATVMMIALREFRGTHERLLEKHRVEMAARGARRGANLVHEDLGRSLSSLRAIATTAPLIGLIGTAIGILDSFRGWIGSANAYIAFIATNLAEALVPTALGLLVSVMGTWCLNWRNDRLAMFDTEMETASIELVKYLR